MPTNFEYSSMKSWSLSSLGAGAAASPGPARAERPYHSLNKKRKEAWRRSWGSAGSGCSVLGGGMGAGDDLWPLLQHHYDYIMDNHIIDTCKEANTELCCEQSAGPGAGAGAIGSEFAQLCRWLDTIQQELYSSPESLANRTLRAKRLAELERAESVRARVAAAAGAEGAGAGAEPGEAGWLARHLLAKWESVRLLLSVDAAAHAGGGAVDTAHEVRCLRRWLHSMEGRLPPLRRDAARDLCAHDLARRLCRHKVLQRDVECHGRVVSQVVRLCGGAAAARALETRWHLLYLRAIEWQCYLEASLNSTCERRAHSAAGGSESDCEPALKQPRLSARHRAPRPARRRRAVRARAHHSEDERRCVECASDASEPELQWVPDEMTSLVDPMAEAEQSVPRTPERARSGGSDVVDGVTYKRQESEMCMYDNSGPPTVVKRRAPDASRVDQSERCSPNASRFDQSERRSRNLATFYYRHTDTDSERRASDAEPERQVSDTEEEEWTYEAGNSCEPKAASRPASRCAQDIERLVAEAEALVAAREVGAGRGKMHRIDQWLRDSNEPRPEQCAEAYDASGEYTTESEVGGGSGASETEDCAEPTRCLLPVLPQYNNKVVMRPKRTSHAADKSPRPWSVACLSQLTRAARAAPRQAALCANSESALHTLGHATLATSTSSVKTTVQGHISSSTTINETCVSCHELGEPRPGPQLGPARRPRGKLRRRAGAGEGAARAHRLVKSQSFSGRLSPPPEEKSERSAASDPTTHHRLEECTSTSGAESGAEGAGAGAGTGAAAYSVMQLRRSIERTHISADHAHTPSLAPNFKVGAAGGAVRARLADPRRLWTLTDAQDASSDRSLTAPTEEHSSFSEQAWDHYQEKYNSEPYSEAPDSEAARRLLEFGDDYRAYLDSDNSSMSRDPAPPQRRRRRVTAESGAARAAERRRGGGAPSCDAALGRPAETEQEREAWALVSRSAARLRDTEALLRHDDAAPDLLLPADYSEVVSTCQHNVSCLQNALSAPGLLSPALVHQVRGVCARWSALRSAAARRGTARRLRRELATLRQTLDDIAEPDESRAQPHNRHHLNRRVDELKERLSRLLEAKVAMLKLTVAARRALAQLESEGEAPGTLAAELAALDAAWDQLHHRTSNELLSLEKAATAWSEWEAGLRELSSSLRSDQAVLRTLTHAPAAGGLQGLADVIADTKSGSTCGSLSDSGISDGDSEAAAAAAAASGARARRLQALRELARQLQAALAPGSHAIRAIHKRMEQAESEVRALQQSCRELVARGGGSGGGVRPEAAARGCATCPGDPEVPARGSWARRVLRSALPFQLCLVALLLAAWLLERPRCCDFLNSLASSLTPQLRYVRGPPPV